jgi:CrcB protein
MHVNWYGFAAVGIGAALGAWLRWLLGATLNSLLPTLPLGTLAANLVGGLLMGCALGAFAHFQALPAEWRLFVMTGFLGGLTTFPRSPARPRCCCNASNTCGSAATSRRTCSVRC